MVDCQTQEEIDYYWANLSAFPEAEQCGWLKDKYGVSWQISPAVMDEMMTKGTLEQRDRVTRAFLKMKKFNIAELQHAFLQAGRIYDSIYQGFTVTPVESVANAFPAASVIVPFPPAVYVTVTPDRREAAILLTVSTT